MFFTFFKWHKWYQIEERVTYEFFFFLFFLEISALSIRIKELEPLQNTVEDLRSKLADEEKIKNALQSGKFIG